MIIDIKRSYSAFYVLISTTGILWSQSPSNELNVTTRSLKVYSDSLGYFMSEFEKKTINLVDYELAAYRISSEISMLAGRNLEITFPVVDSVNSAFNLYDDIIIKDFTEYPIDIIDSSQINNLRIRKPDLLDFRNVLSGIESFKSKTRTRLELSFRIGTIWNKGPGGAGHYDPSINPLENICFDNIHIAFKTRVGKSQSPFYIRYGMGLNYISLRQSGQIQNLIAGKNTPPRFDNVFNPDAHLKVSKLILSYAHFPVQFVWQFGRNISVQAGLFGDLLIGQKNKTISYSDDIKSIISEKKDFGLRHIVTGIHCSVFYRHAGIYWESSSNPVFPDESPTQLKYYKLGIAIR